MIPVLAAADPGGACNRLEQELGFVRAANGTMIFGDAPVLVVPTGHPPIGLMSLRLDHVAFRVPDADEVFAEFVARGARLDAGFTPDGPKDIPEFWEHGVRFVFFEGPEGWPFEFCAVTGVLPTTPPRGHSHYAIRTPELDRREHQLTALGARRIASHLLPGATSGVHVRFLRRGPFVFELFDEPATRPETPSGWIGLIDDGRLE